MTRLGINIDHTATVRQARREGFPDPVALAFAAIQGGADGITAHLREDRRHIQDHDILRLKERLQVPLNLEMAATRNIIDFALRVKPAWCCLVPEKREELTTEGGLDLKNQKSRLQEAVDQLHQGRIKISAFIDPDLDTVGLAKEIGFDAVELHTGLYARACQAQAHPDNCSGSHLALRSSSDHELQKLHGAAQSAKKNGLVVNAGHGLDTRNVKPLIERFPFNELNIGFAIVARALMIGMASAVREMKSIIEKSICVES